MAKNKKNDNESKSTVFRVEKTKNYTVMSNYHLKSKTMSLRAKGLLTLMLSLPEDWDFSLKGLEKLSGDGMTSVRSALKELEEAGYVKRGRFRNELGQLKGTEYFIYEQPQLFNTHIPDVSDKPTSEKLILDKPISEQPILGEPTLENPILEKPTQAKPTLGNRTQLNTKKSNTKELNTDLIKYPSIKDEPPANNDGVGWIDRYNKISAEIKEQIDYETLTLYHGTELINDIVNVMAEVFVIDTSYYTIEGKQIPTELVRENYRKITFDRLEAFLLDFNGLSDRIKNPKKYLITALYNIASTAETSLTNRVNSDFYRGD